MTFNSASKMKFLYYNLKLMNLGSLIPLDKEAGWIRKLIFYFIRVVCLCFTSWSAVITSFYFFYIDNSTEALLKFTNSVVYVGVIIRMVVYYLFDYKAVKIIQFINEKFKLSSNTDLEEISIKYLLNVANFVSSTQSISSFIAGMAFSIVPIIYRKEPISLWYPYDANSSPFFEISHTYQLICQIIIFYYYNITDAFYICVVLATAGQFKILAWEMENVVYTSLIASGFNKEIVKKFKNNLPKSKVIQKDEEFFEIYQFMQTDVFSKQIKSKMIQIIKYHKDVLNLCDYLEDFLSVALLLMFLSILGNSVFIMFGLSVTTSLSSRIQMVTYFLASAIQSFLAAYTSDYLLQESGKLQFSLYSTPWYLCPKQTKTLFLFTHLRLQRDFGISLGKFTRFDLSAYSWVIKTSFSCFTVLRNRREEEQVLTT